MKKNIPGNKNLTKQKKITLATIKSFIRKNEGKIYIYVKSSFDGMVDCVMPTRDIEFVLAKKRESNLSNTLGLQRAWVVGNSDDSFRPYEDSKFIGYNIYNCCGEFILAIKKSSF
jgi:DNA-binding transcriptional regulator LsrR (DeoR family)